MVTHTRAWVFERHGPRGRMSTVCSLANPAIHAPAGNHDRPATSAIPAGCVSTGWTAGLGEHMRLAHSAGRYDILELIAPQPLASCVQRAARDHVDLLVETMIESEQDEEVRRAAARITRRLAAGN